MKIQFIPNIIRLFHFIFLHLNYNFPIKLIEKFILIKVK